MDKLVKLAPNGCSGNCCIRFCLPFSMEELAEKAKKYRGVDVIAAMVIPLNDNKLQNFDPATGERLPDNGKLYHYGCKNFDSETRLCKIHDHKPDMCRDYPYENLCKYKGCKL